MTHRRVLRTLSLVLLSAVGCAALGGGPSSAQSAEEERLDKMGKRVRALERRLDLVDRKLGLLGAKSESELAGSLEVMGSPKLLFKQAKRALKQKDVEVGYRYLTLIWTLHPESEQQREAYALATSAFQNAYFKHRHTPGSIWTTSEPVFMFEWLASYYGEDFPLGRVAALLIGMPYNFFEHFEAYAGGHPRMSAWKVTAIEDNGIVEDVRVEPAKKARKG